MEENVTRRMRQKNDDGSYTEVRLGALADDVLENDQRMFVTKKEKEVLKELTDVIKVVPTQTGTLTYTGTEQNPEWNNYDPNQLEISGQISGTDAGTYTVTFKPKGNRKWADGTSEPKNVSWTIKRAAITNLPTQKGTLTYTGTVQMPSWNGYDKEKMTIGGTVTGTDAGTYTATFAPTKNYQWQDDSTGQKSVDWIIGRAVVDSVPTQSSTLTYTGAEQMPKWNGYDGGKLKIGGQTAGTHAGDYTATFTPTSNYQWTDGSFTAKNAFWTIKRAVIANVPTQKGTLSYTGSVQSPEWNHYDSNQLEIGGTVSAVEEGSYTATFTPKPDYQWSDGSTSSKNVIWKIGSRVIAKLPTQKGTLTYTGSNQRVNWNDYDPELMVIGGTQIAANAGTYTVTFTPQKGTQWWDGTRNAKEVTWRINKAQGRIDMDTTSLELRTGDDKTEVSLSRLGDGTVSVRSNHPEIVSVSGEIENNGDTVRFFVQGIANGEAILTVSCGEGTNHTAAPDREIQVKVIFADPILDNNSPKVIKEVAKSGQAANVWSVGDTIGINLNGSVGAVFLSGLYWAFIIGFDHNSGIEGANTIHFQFGKTTALNDIAFVDYDYGNGGSSAAFRMKPGNDNRGGWNNSYMRKTICPAFFSALPADWQNIIVDCIKYSDNTGDIGDTASNVTSTQDKIWLLAEFEVQGKGTYANSAERNYQKQYDYYKNGNSKVKSKHSDTASTCNWWLRSVYAGTVNGFCIVDKNGTAETNHAFTSNGFAPGFMVA